MKIFKENQIGFKQVCIQSNVLNSYKTKQESKSNYMINFNLQKRLNS